MIGGDFDTPIMYQDLANYTMNPINMPFGTMAGMYGGAGNTSYLGGVRLKPQPDQDKVQLLNKKKEEGKSTLKKALIGIGVCLALGYIPYFRSQIKKAGGIGKYFKDLWASITATKTPKPSFWQRFKNKFKRNSSTKTP